MSIGRSSLILASGTVVSRLLGFVNAVVLARTLGIVGSGADAFALANHLPNTIYSIVAGGVLTAVLVPHIVRAIGHSDGGAGYINKLLTLGILVFAAIATIATLSAPWLVNLYAQDGASGTVGFGPDEMKLAIMFAWWCLPQVFFYAIFSLCSEVLNARGLFGPATWAPIVNNVVGIVGTLILGSVFTGDFSTATDWGLNEVALLGGSATAGVVSQALIIALFLRKAGVRFRFDFNFKGVGLRTASTDALWTLALVAVWQIAVIIQSNVASLTTASGDAGIAVLRFSWLIFMLPHSVVTVSLATAYFTRMSAHVRDENYVAFSNDIRDSIAQIGNLLVIASVGIWVVSPLVTQVFSTADHGQMAAVVSLYVIALLPYGVQYILQRAMYSLGDARTPFIAQVIQTVVFCGIALYVSTKPPTEIAAGLALAMTIAVWIQAAIVAGVLHKKLGKLFDFTEVKSLVVYLVAAIPAAAVGFGIRNLLGDAAPTDQTSVIVLALVKSLVVGIAMIAVYFGTLLALRDKTTRDFVAPLRRLGNKRA
ncbi:MAG: hypothetical protein RLZZ40_1083 [Actinomycetota bacterium]